MNHDGDLPEGWVTKPLGEAARLVKDKVDPTRVPEAFYVGLEHVEAGSMRLLGHGRGADVKSTKSAFRTGDVLYGKLRPYLNKVTCPPFDGICSTDFLVFGESDELDRSYLAQFLNQLSVANYAHHLSAGVELPRVDWKSLSGLPISFPSSKPEQQAIVGEIEKARSLAAQARDHLENVGRAIERCRQAVFAAACSGRLTADWRASRGRIDDGEPVGWLQAEVGSLFDIQNGRAFPSKEYGGEGGVRLLRPGNLSATGEVTWADDRTVRLPSSWAEKHPGFVLGRGELVMNLTAQSLKDEFLGRVCIKRDSEPALLNQRIARFRNRTDEDLRPYALIYFKSARFRRFVNELDSGTLIRHMHSKQIISHVMPMPPTDEREEIVKRTERLLKLGDSITDHINKASHKVDRSSQAVLAKAFHGELIGSG